MLMKKVLYVLTAMLMVAVACKKGETPDPTPGPGPEPEPQPEAASLTLVTPAIVDLDAESGIYTIKFTTNKDWTASVDAEEGTVVLGATSGQPGENIELKVTYQNVSEEDMGRVFNVLIKAGDKSSEVAFFQGLVFAYMADTDAVSVSGGKVEYLVITNLEYTIKKYDGAEEAFPWAPVTIVEEDHRVKITFNVAANPGYDTRSAYVKFTVPAIQVPVIDEETGEPTGETEDYVERLYVYQEGHASVAWLQSLPADFDVTNLDEPLHDATVSVAKFNGMVLVSDAVTVRAFDPATGAAANFAFPEGLPVQSITNDDAGNLLVASFIPYGGVGSIYAIRATDTQMASPVLLIPWVNDAWSGSRGADKVAAKGDVFGNGIVTMIYGGVISYGGLTYCLAWEIKNGAADVYDYNEWNKSTHKIFNDTWFTSPELGDDLWLSNRAVFAPAGPAVSDGFFYSGYDGKYCLYYYNGSEWTAVAEDIANWAYAPNGMASITWNGKKILAISNMAYFPEWSMPSALYIVDVTNPTAPVLLSNTEYYNPADEYVTGAQESSTTDVMLEVEGNDLCATVVDSAWGVLLKIKYPKL